MANFSLNSLSGTDLKSYVLLATESGLLKRRNVVPLIISITTQIVIRVWKRWHLKHNLLDTLLV